MNVAANIQCLVAAILAGASIVAVTVLNMIFLNQLAGIFYTTPINFVIVAAIVIGTISWMHKRLMRYSPRNAEG
jgi:hypothetical protein